MATVPPTARVVVIGAGIVGNSLVHHLARLGWRDIVQIDKGRLPNPGGSTGHASNFIFPVDHSREITDLTLDSVRQYQELGVFTESGGFEVARTEERMEELRRRMSSAKAWGIEAELVTPEAVNFMAMHGRGLVCLSMTEDRLRQLGIPLMAPEAPSVVRRSYGASIEARRGVSTGISAHDRATTIQAAISNGKYRTMPLDSPLTPALSIGVPSSRPAGVPRNRPPMPNRKPKQASIGSGM